METAVAQGFVEPLIIQGVKFTALEFTGALLGWAGRQLGSGFVNTLNGSTTIANGINQSYGIPVPDYGGDNETANNLRNQGQVFGYGTQVIMNLPSSGISSSTPNLSPVTVQGPRLTPPAVPAIKTTHVVLTSSSNTNADVDEGHHLLPKQFEPYFKRAGLDVEKYKIPLPRSRHRLKPNGVHTTNGGNWNNRWKEFFAANPNASKETILQFLAKLRSEFGI